jgi:hypothetical protein
MRGTILAALLALLATSAAAQHEEAAVRQTLPRDVRREVVDKWNGENAIRSSDRLEIAEGQQVGGNVAVQRGPLIIGGHVTGSVLAINTDVLLKPTARIDGDLLVVGGDVDGRNIARVDGAIRIYRQSLRYTESDGRISADEEDGESNDNWWRRLEHRNEENWIDMLRVVQAGPYNRVEGLPIELGPVLARRTSWGSVRFDAGAVLRTGSVESEGGDIGHRIRGEVRVGHGNGVGIGARAFSVVDPVESWEMSNVEVALASFLSRRDYRDYYQRHGGAAFLTLYGARDISLTGSFGEERWASRPAGNPFTLFNDDRPWRANPAVDEGLFHIGTLTFNFDTRSDPDDPWAGWYVNADFEHGSGTINDAAANSIPRASGGPGADQYTRGFLDLRRYNRLGPAAQLNMRLVLGGWLAGDPLPLERRLSVDGPGSLPGFGFRNEYAGYDVGTCNTQAVLIERPAACERIALAQVEYRGNLRLDFMGNWDDWPRHYHSDRGDVMWVLFADAGRGWNVTPSVGAPVYDAGEIPPLSSFRTDIGLGLDFSGIGIYAAKAVSTPEPVNFFVRLHHRF